MFGTSCDCIHSDSLGAIQHGHPYYGCHVGILVFNGISPRVPGDAGHAQTFDYPVDYEVIDGCFAKLANNDEQTKLNVINGARNLVNRGVNVIAGDCGLMGLYQDEIASCGKIAAASSLVLIPTLWHMIGCTGKIGIVTGHSELLSKECLSACGCDDIPLAIQGMENEPHFSEIVINGGLNLNVEKMQNDTVHAASVLCEKNPDVRAIILECSNLATYSAAVAAATQRPVFDLVSAISLMEHAVFPPCYL